MYRTAILVPLAFTLACSTARVTTSDMPRAAEPGPEITFVVREAGRLPLERITGVEVVVIGRDGTSTRLGRTFDGRLTVNKRRIRDVDPIVVLFCHEAFHCGALHIEGPEWKEFSIFHFDLWNVDLARLVLYD